MSSSQEQAIFTVSQLNTLAKDILESSFPNILVEGEISNLVLPRSGHAYFSLKDEKSQIRVALFAGNKQRLSFKLEDGLKVIVKGGLSLYAPRGDYQLIAKTLEPSGEGALRKEFELLKQELAKRGWFDEQLKKPLPEFCKHLAVVTSPSGAAIRDILHVLERRFPMMEITIFPSLVQGSEASKELVHAIQTANKLKSSGNLKFQFDALLLARGGGSLEDLWPFNEETLAAAIHESTLPVISGVGHETDYTICDWVADFRAPTPSAAAESLSQDQLTLQAWLLDQQSTLTNLLKKQLTTARQNLIHLSKRCTSPRQMLNERMQKLDYLENRLMKAQSHKLLTAEQSLAMIFEGLKRLSPRNLVELKQKEHKHLSKRLENALSYQRTKAHGDVEHLAARLHNLSPLNTLNRGYSITRLYESDQWQLLGKQAPQIDEKLQTETSELILESRITLIKHK